jgi:hypothetical protein
MPLPPAILKPRPLWTGKQVSLLVWFICNWIPVMHFSSQQHYRSISCRYLQNEQDLGVKP